MQDVIATLLVDPPSIQSKIFESSGWLEERDIEQLEAIYKEYSEHYARRLETLTDLLGPPAQTEAMHREEIGTWYPEAMRAACWRRGEKTLCLALELADRAAPACVVVKCVTDDEIEELSA